METLIDEDGPPDEELYAILGVSRNVSLSPPQMLPVL
jgi:hypothetical protein